LVAVIGTDGVLPDVERDRLRGRLPRGREVRDIVGTPLGAERDELVVAGTDVREVRCATRVDVGVERLPVLGIAGDERPEGPGRLRRRRCSAGRADGRDDSYGGKPPGSGK